MSVFHQDYRPRDTPESASDAPAYLAFLAGAVFAVLVLGFFLELSR